MIRYLFDGERMQKDPTRPSQRSKYQPGHQIRNLTILRVFDRTPKRAIRWLCRCACGVELIVSNGNMRNQSGCRGCGHLLTAAAKTTHGATKSSGAIRAPLYKTWRSMLGRCGEKSEHNRWYAGKGIKVCDEWLKDYAAFRDWSISAGWKEGLSIDRIDTDKGYSPSNCRWLTRSQNSKRIVYTNPFAEHFPIEALWGTA